MSEHENISEIDREAALIAAEIKREADVLVNTLFAVPIGMERMTSTKQALERLNLLTTEERMAFFQANPDALNEFMSRNGTSDA